MKRILWWMVFAGAVACGGSREADGVGQVASARAMLSNLTVSADLLPPVSADFSPDVAALTFDGAVYWAAFAAQGAIYLARLSADGSPLDRSARQLAVANPSKLAVIAGGDRNLVIWSTSSGIFGMHAALDGAPLDTAPVTLTSASTEFAAAGDGAGNVMLTWIRPTDFAIVALPWLANGSVGTPAPVDPGARSVWLSLRPVISFGGGSYLVAWGSGDPYASFSGTVLAERIDQSASPIDPQPITLGTTRPTLASAFDGMHHVVVWTDVDTMLPVSARIGTDGVVAAPGAVPVSAIASSLVGQFAVVPRVNDDLMFFEGEAAIEQGVPIAKADGAALEPVPRSFSKISNPVPAASDGEDALVLSGGRAFTWSSAVTSGDLPSGVPYAQVPDGQRSAIMAFAFGDTYFVQWTGTHGNAAARISADGSHAELVPAAAYFPSLTDGTNLVSLWMDDTSHPGDALLMAMRTSPDGTPLDPQPVLVTDEPIGNATLPGIASAAFGEGVYSGVVSKTTICPPSSTPCSPIGIVEGVRLSQDGVPLGNFDFPLEPGVTSASQLSYSGVHLASGPSGVVAMWSVAPYDYFNCSENCPSPVVHLARLAADGTFGAVVDVFAGATTGMSLASNGQTYLAAWSTPQGTFGRLFDPTLTPLGEPIPIADSGTVLSQLLATGSGYLALFEHPFTDLRARSISATGLVDDSDTIVVAEQPINPNAVSLGDGRALVTYGAHAVLVSPSAVSSCDAGAECDSDGGPPSSHDDAAVESTAYDAGLDVSTDAPADAPATEVEPADAGSRPTDMKPDALVSVADAVTEGAVAASSDAALYLDSGAESATRRDAQAADAYARPDETIESGGSSCRVSLAGGVRHDAGSLTFVAILAGLLYRRIRGRPSARA
jgi:hypothetical protein